LADFLPNWDNSRGFLIDNAGCVAMGGAGDIIFSAWFFLYIIRRKDQRSCDGQDGQKEFKQFKYKKRRIRREI
jgi:hypothetical protein